MKVYTYYDSSPDAPPHQAELIRLWDRSWTARGFETRLLTQRHAQSHKNLKLVGDSAPFWPLALSFKTNYRNDGWFVPAWVINYGLTGENIFKERREKKLPAFKRGCFWPRLDYLYSIPYGVLGWQTSSLVEFPKCASMDDILNCGRALQ